jgi:hypothetical protein
MKYLGIGHYSRTGKDSLANMIIELNNGFNPENRIRIKKISLAWKLKQICYELYAWAGMMPPEHYDTPEGEGDRELILRPIGMTPVEIWVAMGTPAVRENVYDRTWIDYVLQTDHDCDLLITPDVRFPNEGQEWKYMGGKLVKTVRAGYGPRNTVADKALLGYQGWDLVAGPTMASLRNQAATLLAWAVDAAPFPTQTIATRQMLLDMEKIPTCSP